MVEGRVIGDITVSSSENPSMIKEIIVPQRVIRTRRHVQAHTHT